MKPWSKRQIGLHIIASELVNEVHQEGFQFIRDNPNTDEYTVQQFIHKQFKKRNLISTAPQIVAFGPSIASPHYTPTKKNTNKLKDNQLIEFDLWARLKKKGATYTDMTWMSFYGNKMPPEQKRAFTLLLKARDAGVNHLKNRIHNTDLPTGKAIDDATNKVLLDNGFIYRKHIKHGTGHPLGFVSPHGRGRNINQKNHVPILVNVPYTIEPGIYVDGKFGMRSEIDVMVTSERTFHFTSSVQRAMVFL